MSQTLNPYGKILGEKDPQTVIAATPERLRELSRPVSSEKAEQSYAPGKWTFRQIICHLADCEIAFSFRWRQTIAETNHIIQPFDQDAWSQKYNEADSSQALDVFCALRAWNLAFLKSQPVEVLTKPVTHPERGTMTFASLLQTMAGHDLNHLAQLEIIAGHA